MADKTPTAKDISLLIQRPELADKFDKVYGDGAAAKILAKPQAVPQRKEEKAGTFEQYMGAATRGLAPSVVGGAALSPLGPIPALVGASATAGGDFLNSLINLILAGGEKISGQQMPRLQMPSQVVQDLLTRAGVAKPTGTGPQLVEAGMGALGGTASQIGALQKLAQAAPSVTQSVAQQMAQRPVAQMVVAPPAGMAAQQAAQAVQPYGGDIGAMLAGMLAGTTVGGAGMAIPTRPRPTPSMAEQRATRVAQTAADLGFEGETALTPAQRGTNRTAQIFEGVVSNIPGSAGQMTKRYMAQSDKAEQILNSLAGKFGGMPEAPDTAMSVAANAVRNAVSKNVDDIGSSIREVASKSDIPLSEVPKFQEQIMKIRAGLQSIPPALRRDPLFQGFEEFYFGKPNTELTAMVNSFMEQAGIDRTNPKYAQTAASVRKQLIDSGTPEFEFQGYAQKGFIPGADYQDQRVLFGQLAEAQKGTKVGQAFKQLQKELDTAREITFKNAGMDDDLKELKSLRASYGDAVDLKQRFATAKDATVVRSISTNESQAANNVIPLLDNEGKLKLAQGVLADIKLESLTPAGDLDITKFGKTIINRNERSPSTLPNIFGMEDASTMIGLADVAQTALKAKIPTSGTAERSQMTQMLTSTPAKVGAAMAGGTAITGEPFLGTALALGTPALATKAYLSPTVQNLYERMNVVDPLLNYMRAPINPMLEYAASPNLLYSAPQIPYIELRGMAQPD